MTTETKHERPSIGEVYDSLTWHDETAIENAFAVSVHDLMAEFADDNASIKTLMALVRSFELIRLRRDGLNDTQALAKVRLMTNAEITDLLAAYFGAESDGDEQDEDESRDFDTAEEAALEGEDGVSAD